MEMEQDYVEKRENELLKERIASLEKCIADFKIYDESRKAVIANFDQVVEDYKKKIAHLEKYQAFLESERGDSEVIIKIRQDLAIANEERKKLQKEIERLNRIISYNKYVKDLTDEQKAELKESNIARKMKYCGENYKALETSYHETKKLLDKAEERISELERDLALTEQQVKDNNPVTVTQLVNQAIDIIDKLHARKHIEFCRQHPAPNNDEALYLDGIARARRELETKLPR